MLTSTQTLLAQAQAGGYAYPNTLFEVPLSIRRLLFTLSLEENHE